MSDGMVVTDLGAWYGQAPLMLTLPLPPNRANARWHWRTEKRKKDEYYLACLARYGKRTLGALVFADITATLYTHQPMDEDNLHARLKWPLDWLVKRAFIADDNPDVITLDVRQAIDRKDQRVEILISGVPAW